MKVKRILLIYVDDIVLASQSIEEHRKLWIERKNGVKTLSNTRSLSKQDYTEFSRLPRKRIHLFCDASSTADGAMFFQEDESRELGTNNCATATNGAHINPG